MQTRIRVTKAVSPIEKGKRILSEQARAEIEVEQAKWEAGVLQESLKQKPETKRVQTEREFRGGEGGVAVKRLYTPLDIADISYEKDIGFPGQYPFTRGMRPCGYRTEEELLLSFYSGYGSAENSNRRYKDLFAAGAGDIWFATDLPTQIGYDSDDPLCEAEVGKAGVALDTLRDMEILLEGIQLDKVKLGSVSNCIGPWFLATFLAAVEKRGVSPEKAYCWVQNDPFKEWISRNTWVLPTAATVDLAADATVYSCQHMPTWDPQYIVALGGMGYGIAGLIYYIEAALKKGIKLEQVAPRLHIHGGISGDFFTQIAGFRAARRLWAKIARERFKTDDPRVLALRQTLYTGGGLTAQQPLNNIVRNTVHVLASLLGGAEQFLSQAYDEALAIPTFEAAWLAGLTRNILHYEWAVDDTVDPLGGSYFIENLTNELEEKIRQSFEEVEAMGGPLVAIESGFFKRKSAEQTAKNQKAVESGEKVVVGVNKYVRDEEELPEIFDPDPEAEARQIERLHKVKKERDNALVERCLAQIRKIAEEKAGGKDSNIMPSMLDAVKAYASLGEIYGIFREVFGEYKPSKEYI